MKYVILFLLLISSFSFAQKLKAKEEIKKVMKQYFTSVKTKDSITFYSLFYSNDVTWHGTYKDKTLEEESHHSHKLREVITNTFKNFMNDIAQNSVEIKYDNVKIIEDGRVASVNFDYSFWENAKMQNWGREIWTMVKFNNRWKITSVLFSMEQVKYNPQPPLKERLKLN